MSKEQLWEVLLHKDYMETYPSNISNNKINRALFVKLYQQ